MAFRFKLESVLKVRCLQEEQCRKNLADALLLYEQENLHLGKLLELQNKAEQDVVAQQKEPLSAHEALLYHQYVQKIAARAVEQKSKVIEADALCNLKRQQLLEAVKRRKALETLKNKELKNYNLELKRREEKFINEIAITRFHRNGR